MSGSVEADRGNSVEAEGAEVTRIGFRTRERLKQGFIEVNGKYFKVTFLHKKTEDYTEEEWKQVATWLAEIARLALDQHKDATTISFEIAKNITKVDCDGRELSIHPSSSVLQDIGHLFLAVTSPTYFKPYYDITLGTRKQKKDRPCTFVAGLAVARRLRTSSPFTTADVDKISVDADKAYGFVRQAQDGQTLPPATQELLRLDFGNLLSEPYQCQYTNASSLEELLSSLVDKDKAAELAKKTSSPPATAPAPSAPSAAPAELNWPEVCPIVGVPHPSNPWDAIDAASLVGGVLTIEGHTFGLVVHKNAKKEVEKIEVFDPLGEKGKACVMTFKNIAKLQEYLLKRYPRVDVGKAGLNVLISFTPTVS